MTTAPFTVVGESLVDIVVRPDGTTNNAAGGSPMNVAVGLARLDVPSLLLTRFGDDAHGTIIASHVNSSGVLLPPDAVQPGTTTSTATAHLDDQHSASYDFDLSWDLTATALLDDTLGLHVGSLGTSLHPGRAAVLDMVAQAVAREVFVSYDPNVRPWFVDDPLREWEQVRALAGCARLVKLSDEDLHTLRPGSPVEALVDELLTGAHTELVVVTAGPRGASAFTASARMHTGGVPVTVVDTVGAGDAFMAGALAVLVGWDLTVAGPGALAALDEDRLRILLTGALTVAAMTCARSGANPPTRRELPTTWPV